MCIHFVEWGIHSKRCPRNTYQLTHCHTGRHLAGKQLAWRTGEVTDHKSYTWASPIQIGLSNDMARSAGIKTNVFM